MNSMTEVVIESILETHRDEHGLSGTFPTFLIHATPEARKWLAQNHYWTVDYDGCRLHSAYGFMEVSTVPPSSEHDACIVCPICGEILFQWMSGAMAAHDAREKQEAAK